MFSIRNLKDQANSLMINILVWEQTNDIQFLGVILDPPHPQMSDFRGHFTPPPSPPKIGHRLSKFPMGKLTALCTMYSAKRN